MKEIVSLTSLRGIAALTVVVAHYDPEYLGAFRALFYWHNAALDLFFCLSGFILCYTYKPFCGRHLDAKAYLFARFGRVYPLYLVSEALMLAFLIQWDTPSYPAANGWHDLWMQLFMINAWPGIGDGVHWNFPAWSLSVEVFCYLLVFPVLFRIEPKLSARGSTIVVLACSLVSFVAYLNYFDPQTLAARVYRAASVLSYYVGTLRGILMFMNGWVLYRCFLLKNEVFAFCTRHCDGLSLVCLAVIAALPFGMEGHVLVMVFPFLMLGTVAPGSITNAVLRQPPIYYLGIISYSVYLLHMPAKLLFDRMAAIGLGFANPLAETALQLAGLLLIASFSYHAFERPARRMIRALGGVRK